MLKPEEIRRFERRIAEDPAFAEEVAFYLSAKQSLKTEANQEKKERFRQLLPNKPRSLIWIKTGLEKKPGCTESPPPLLSSSLVSLLVCFLLKACIPHQMADTYINKDLKTWA
jgi:hypothetical protein